MAKKKDETWEDVKWPVPLSLALAAPDLLGACQTMLRLMEGEDFDEKWPDEADQLRDAIAKAEGNNG